MRDDGREDGIRWPLGWAQFAAVVVLACVSAGAALGTAALGADGTPHILTLYDNHSLLPATDAIEDGLYGTLQARAPDRFELYTEFLDSSRFPDAEHKTQMLAMLREKYAATHIDLLFAIGPAALEFLSEYRASLFPDAAIVFAAVSERSLAKRPLPPNTTGIVSRFDPVMTLELALRLQPDARHLFVVTGAAPFDRSWEAVARDKFAPYEDRLDVTYLAGLPLQQLLTMVGRLPAHSIIIHFTVFEDGTGAKFIPRDVVEKVSAAANAPVYSAYDTVLGYGIVGGFMDTFEAVGAAAAGIGLRVLAGEPPESIRPEEAETHRFIVDWRQLRRWGLSEANLPPDAVIRFKELSFWDRYKVQGTAVIAVVVLQRLLITGLALQARRRRRAEASLNESEERMSLAVESTTLGIWQLDVPTYRIWATDTCRQILGLDPQEVLTSKSFMNVCHPDDLDRTTQTCVEAIAQGKSYDQEYRVVHPDGRVRWVLDRARNVGDTSSKSRRMTGVIIDITERKQAEQALRESEERYRNVVETQTEMICRFLPDTTLTFVNDAYCRFFGRARDQLVGTKFVDLIPKSARPGVLRHVESIMQNPRTQIYEHEVLQPDGSIGWQQWFDHAIVDSTGQVVELQGIGRDTTQLKRAELDAQERREEVTHLTRVAILGELSGALAHELNQPLTAILSNAQAAQRLMERDPVDLDEVRAILADIADDDKRAGDVINRLRALMKKGEAKLLPLGLNNLAADVLGLAHSELIERSVEVTTRLAPGLPDIHGDRVQLQQVVLNLLMNACEAMDETPPGDRSIVISTEHDGNGTLRMAVTDRGDGIPAGIIDRVFEPFATTKKHGLGLGLSICRSIIAAHGGRLSAANNRDDRGATFLISLPIHPGGHA